MFKSILAGSSWLMADKLLRMFLGLIVGSLIARHLGPLDYGALTYAIAFVAIFGYLSTFGVDAVLIRDLSRERNQRPVLVGSALTLRLLGGSAAYAACLFTTAILQGEGDDNLFLVAVLSSGFVFQSLDVFDQWLQTEARYREIALIRTSMFTVLSMIRLGLIAIGAGKAWFAIMIAVESLMVACALWLAYRHLTIDLPRLSFDTLVARRLLRESWPLAVSGLFVILTMQMDKVMIGLILDESQVGIYGVASQISSVWYMFPVVVGTVAAPSLARLQRHDVGAYRMNLMSLYRLVALASVLIASLLSLIAEPLIRCMFGSDYVAAAPILMAHAWTTVFVFHVSIRTRALVAEGKQIYVTMIAALTFLTSVCLSAILIPRHGAIGAAHSLLLAWSACAILFPLLHRETRGSASIFIASFLPSRFK